MDAPIVTRQQSDPEPKLKSSRKLDSAGLHELVELQRQADDVLRGIYPGVMVDPPRSLKHTK